MPGLTVKLAIGRQVSCAKKGRYVTGGLDRALNIDGGLVERAVRVVARDFTNDNLGNRNVLVVIAVTIEVVEDGVLSTNVRRCNRHRCANSTRCNSAVKVRRRT